ncbi:flagellar basal body P-ring formation chaperone FlgA [Paracoccus sp. SCSIO 75233]|uniref:flagellar basal body P-ring formation chaperone FlgA n=1 Tax=Paracoccus sp. SCSIO 75233 TaxID=3017782 RepID=UPI0022F02F2B|nr:flagellar basal body P-ring formation chaperone FlgA [Paracoccus sp. SCSIO 75233]WBU53455.1 flagellar basal body P-ring formation chaperone FlgA [Paracoccus sp. SCSIO 75233]
MRGALLMAVLLAPVDAAAGVVAARNLPPGTVIAADDLGFDPDAPGIGMAEEAVGLQTRIAIYEGRPVMAGALRPPVLVSRNQIVRMAYEAGSLEIVTEGRALTEGAAGDDVRVMNLASRTTVSAKVMADGAVVVAGHGVMP